MQHWNGHQGIAVGLGVLAAVAALLMPASPAAAARPNSTATTPGWQELTNPPPFDPGLMFLLTDGTVLVQDLGPTAAGSGSWWRLTPDSSGSYVDGTWSQIASMPTGYAPEDYASAVLPDGRLAIEGGEYNEDAAAWSNLGAIYDPLSNTWKMVSPPKGWTKIGDAPSEVLADGRWLVGDSGSDTADDAILNPANLTWTTTGGAGRVIGNAEAGFTLLPDGKLLSVDVIPPACSTRTAELFDPATLAWSSAGTTPAPLVNCGDLSEIGPQILMYSGKVFVEGATKATTLYDVSTGTWSPGPNLPVIGGLQYSAQDSGDALLPDGNVLVALSPGVFDPPTHFFLFDGTSLTQVADNGTSSLRNNGNTHMLLLPTGQVLYTPGLGSTSMEVFDDFGTPSSADAPALTGVYPARLAPGVTYEVEGTQLNGLSDGAAFGDDYQPSTDYPLVQITNDGTGDVAYARTSGMTNRSIASGASSCTDFTLPNGIETGTAELRVVANGIASVAYPVTIGAGGSRTDLCPTYPLSLAKTGSGSGTVTSSAAGIACGTTCSHSYLNGTIVTLKAAPAKGSAFAGWSGGGCSGTGACLVTITGATSVTAKFDLLPEQLTVARSGDGAGSVKSSPAGIGCGSSCGHAYSYGTSVTLNATAATGSSFAGWMGSCTGKASCVLGMTSARSVIASFVKDCVVPKLKGKRVKAARRALKTHDCSVGKIKHAASKKVKKGHVISQKPKPGKQLGHDAKVKLVVSKGPMPPA